VRGLLLHAVLAVDAASGAVLGLVDADVWNRTGGKVSSRRARRTAEKESQRWIDATRRASDVLASARHITSVSDRESDIYEHIASTPPNVDVILRACQNRKIVPQDEDQAALLFPFIESLPEQGRFTAQIPAAPGREARTSELAVRFSPFVLRRPDHVSRDLPETASVTVIDVRETSRPQKGEPIHWRLLTTHKVTTSPRRAGSSTCIGCGGPLRSTSTRSRRQALISRVPISASPGDDQSGRRRSCRSCHGDATGPSPRRLHGRAAGGCLWAL
jgi:hypothetical protein